MKSLIGVGNKTALINYLRQTQGKWKTGSERETLFVGSAEKKNELMKLCHGMEVCLPVHVLLHSQTSFEEKTTSQNFL